MNKITLLGRLTKDPELRSTQSGKSVCSFTLAVDRPVFNKGQKKETDFFNCTLWDKRGEAFAKYFAKGQRALIEGRVQFREYNDKSGAKRLATDVVVNDFYFIEKKGDKSESVEQLGTPVELDEDIPF